MSEPKVIKYAVFDIDVDTDSFSEIDITEINDNDLLRFILKLAAETSSNETSRKAIFSASSYVKLAVGKLIKDNSTELLSELARQLLVTEKESNQRIKHLKNSIRSGSLIVAKVERSSDTFVILAKIEFSSYISRQSFLLEVGVPEEKSLTRSCLVNIEGGEACEEILLSGSNSVIPAYWHSGFLNSEFVRDNAINTEKAFKLIESKISYIKDVSPDDYADIRDCLIGYFKGNQVFSFDELTENLTEKFVPESKDVDLNILKIKLQKLKEQDKFDGSFEIDKSQVKARLRRRYSLDNDVHVLAKNGTSTIFQTEHLEKSYVVIESLNIPKDLRKIDF